MPYCSACVTEVVPEDPFCRGCGARRSTDDGESGDDRTENVERTPVPDDATRSAPSTDRRTLLMYGGGASVLALAGGGIYYGILRDDEEEGEEVDGEESEGDDGESISSEQTEEIVAEIESTVAEIDTLNEEVIDDPGLAVAYISQYETHLDTLQNQISELQARGEELTVVVDEDEIGIQIGNPVFVSLSFGMVLTIKAAFIAAKTALTLSKSITLMGIVGGALLTKERLVSVFSPDLLHAVIEYQMLEHHGAHAGAELTELVLKTTAGVVEEYDLIPDIDDEEIVEVLGLQDDPESTWQYWIPDVTLFDGRLVTLEREDFATIRSNESLLNDRVVDELNGSEEYQMLDESLGAWSFTLEELRLGFLASEAYAEMVGQEFEAAADIEEIGENLDFRLFELEPGFGLETRVVGIGAETSIYVDVGEEDRGNAMEVLAIAIEVQDNPENVAFSYYQADDDYRLLVDDLGDGLFQHAIFVDEYEENVDYEPFPEHNFIAHGERGRLVGEEIRYRVSLVYDSPEAIDVSGTADFTDMLTGRTDIGDAHDQEFSTDGRVARWDGIFDARDVRWRPRGA